MRAAHREALRKAAPIVSASLGRRQRYPTCEDELLRIAALLSILLYAFGLVAAVAALAVVRPMSWLGLRTRRRAFVAWLLAVAAGVGTLAWPAHETRVASPVSRLDQIVPIYQFSEVHETTIEASPERTYRTICAVTVNEIALLGLGVTPPPPHHVQDLRRGRRMDPSPILAIRSRTSSNIARE